VYKKTRKHSALLLLMAPIIAIGSTALVAGTAASAGATAKKAVSPTIKICEAAPGAFRFVLNGRVVSLNGKCEVFTAKIGVNQVTEVSAPALYRSISSISVTPAQVRVNSSLKTASIALRLAAGRSATVTFANSKLVVVVSGPAPVTPPPSSPSSPSSPAPGNPAPGNPAPGNPAPGNPAPGNPAPGNPTVGGSDPLSGYIEICKSAADPWVEGTFTFTVNGGTTVYPLTLTPPAPWPLTDLAGFGFRNVAPTVCTGYITVPAGTVTVVEGSGSEPGYGLASVTAAPPAALGTVDLATQTATFTVTSGLETTADFVDATQLNFIKVCKVLANNFGTANDTVSAGLAGTPIDYDVAWTFTPSTPALTTASFGPYTESASVVAVPAPGMACSLIPWAIPAGSAVTVTEPQAVVTGAVPNDAPPYISVSGVSIVPSQFNAATATTPVTEAALTVPPVSDGYADAIFTNTPMGAIEVCKTFDPVAYNNGVNSATFTVAGVIATTFTLTPGLNGCSPEMAVPVGTATVDETTANTGNFLLESVFAYGPEGTTGSNRLLSPVASGSSTASVSVPYGGEGNITEVVFTNEVDGTQFKICKQTSDPALAGDTFTFAWRISGGPSVSVTLTLPEAVAGVPYSALVCSDLITGPPAVNPNGLVTPITVVEAGTAHVQATAGTWSGATGLGFLGGLLSGTSSFPTSPGASATVVFAPSAGTNAVTFTNQSHCACSG
jgi:hypothetical protein